MASQTLQPGDAPANALSRRGLIGALAAAPVLAGSLAVSASAGAAQQGATAMNMHTTILPARTRTAWDRAMAAREAAKRAHEEFDARVWRPLAGQAA
jgi:hypothetical protein